MSKWTVKNYSQATTALCWEACARILWDWKYGSLHGYAEKARHFKKAHKGGLVAAKMDSFYHLLGMRGVFPAGANDLRIGLLWSPVIFTEGDETYAHALVASGFDGTEYSVSNPCFSETINFGTGPDSCEGKSLQLKASELEKSLGTYIWYWSR